MAVPSDDLRQHRPHGAGEPPAPVSAARSHGGAGAQPRRHRRGRRAPEIRGRGRPARPVGAVVPRARPDRLASLQDESRHRGRWRRSITTASSRSSIREDRGRLQQAAQDAIDGRSDYIVECRLLGGGKTQRWAEIRGAPPTMDDWPTGMVGLCLDVTARKEAEDRQNLLIRELHHRVKNTLSTVQAIVGATARGGDQHRPILPRLHGPDHFAGQHAHDPDRGILAEGLDPRAAGQGARPLRQRQRARAGERPPAGAAVRATRCRSAWPSTS